MTLPILVLGHRQRVSLRPRAFPAQRFWPGCSAWMILAHAAAANGLGAEELRDWLAPPRNGGPTRRWFDWSLADPARLRAGFRDELGLPRTVAESAGLAVGPERLAGQLRVCRSCLRQGVHALAHQWRGVGVCPVHGERLAEACPDCRRPIDYRFSALAFRLPGRCPHCAARLVPMAAIGCPPGPGSSLAKALGAFVERLAEAPDDPPTDQRALSAWLSALPGLPPPLSGPGPAARRRLAEWRRLMPGDFASRSDPAWHEGGHLYRQAARLDWRRLDTAARCGLMAWARAHPGPMARPAAGELTMDQFAHLAWRMTWEARRAPAALFRQALVPATGVAVWLAHACPIGNDFELGADDADPDETAPRDGGPSAGLSAPERQALTAALAGTHDRWRQLAGEMRRRGRFLLSPDLVPIPDGFGSPWR